MGQSTQTIETIKRDVTLLRSFMIGIAGKDKEGSYRPEFVARLLSRTSEQPKYRFQNAKSFLEHLRA